MGTRLVPVRSYLVYLLHGCFMAASWLPHGCLISRLIDWAASLAAWFGDLTWAAPRGTARHFFAPSEGRGLCAAAPRPPPDRARPDPPGPSPSPGARRAGRPAADIAFAGPPTRRWRPV